MTKTLDWSYVLASNNLPKAPEEVVDGRWIARSGDWYIKTARGWYWLGSNKQWVFCPLGVCS